MATSGHFLTPQIPKYLVAPTSFSSLARDSKSCQVKVIDFGEAFLHGQQRQIRCPLVFRAPEAVLTSQWDLRADVWSLGCTVCHLFCSDSRDFLLADSIDIRADRRIPSFRWFHAEQRWSYPRMGFNVWRSTGRMDKTSSSRGSHWCVSQLPLLRFFLYQVGLLWSYSNKHLFLSGFWFRNETSNSGLLEDLESRQVSLVEWLKETYFDDDKRTYFSKADIESACALLLSMMQYHPSNRPRVSELLNHDWLQHNLFARKTFLCPFLSVLFSIQ